MTSVPTPLGGGPQYGAIGAAIDTASTTITVRSLSLEFSVNITSEGEMS